MNVTALARASTGKIAQFVSKLSSWHKQTRNCVTGRLSTMKNVLTYTAIIKPKPDLAGEALVFLAFIILYKEIPQESRYD